MVDKSKSGLEREARNFLQSEPALLNSESYFSRVQIRLREARSEMVLRSEMGLVPTTRAFVAALLFGEANVSLAFSSGVLLLLSVFLVPSNIEENNK